jgi:hypothetical protein
MIKADSPAERKKAAKLNIKKHYVINEHNEPVAVQTDLATFEKIEQLLEDYALGQKIKEVEEERPLNRATALRHYVKLKKGQR